MRKSIYGRQPQAAGQDSNSIETELESLASKALEELRSEWRRRFGADPPLIRSRDVLLRIMAWQIQADAYGGLDLRTERKLTHIGDMLERNGSYEPQTLRSLSPGIELTREWKGSLHTVTVTADGFQHLGKTYRSLSDIARTITGTRWSGPRFFGLETRTKPKPEKTAP